MLVKDNQDLSKIFVGLRKENNTRSHQIVRTFTITLDLAKVICHLNAIFV